MQILAHRGYWKKISEKNTRESFRRAFENGFGIETDLRDFHGKLVISHNVADASCFLAEQMFLDYESNGCSLPLALNVKADGIQFLLEPLLNNYSIMNYFLFDMSVPEMVVNEREGLKFYTRQSDIEKECVLYGKAEGVWLDSFYTENWLTEEILFCHLNAGKKVGIISPEIHGFDNCDLWEMLKTNNFSNNDAVALCTDLPEKARKFFHE